MIETSYIGFKETDKYNDNQHAELYFELVL